MAYDETPEEQLVHAIEDREFEIRNAARRSVGKLARTIMSCGDFRMEDGKMVSDNPKANEWVLPFNIYQLRCKTAPEDADDQYIPTLIKLFDPTIAKYAGIPHFNGMTLHITAGTKHPKEPWIDKFKAKVCEKINDDWIIRDTKKIFESCIQAAVRVRLKVKPKPDWVTVGKYLMLHRNQDQCKIVKRGKVVDRRTMDQITLYHVVTPHRIFVLKSVLPGSDRIGSFRKQEVFIKTHWGTAKFSIELEERAMEKLRAMITPEQYRQYFVTGTFEEYSPRSHIAYFLRRLKPTIAMKQEGTEKDHNRAYCFLAGLCLHPLSYNMDSFAGSQCPTDDVMNHLLWIRGDERRFWAKANHHTIKEVECGM